MMRCASAGGSLSAPAGYGKTTLIADWARRHACNFVIGSPLDREEFGVIRAKYREGVAWLPRKLEALKRHCDDVGRPYSEIEKTVVTRVKIGPDAMSAQEVIDICHELSGLGFQQVMFGMPDVHAIEPIERFGREIIPKVLSFGAHDEVTAGDK